MLNPQELRDKTFEKAVFGGYDMAAVDDFLSEVTEDYAALHKEVSVLKAKMKVLVDKIEEYRGSETAVNKTLLTAQRVSAEIEEETNERCDMMLREAERTAEKIVGNARAEVAAEQARLITAKRSSADFIEKMRAMCTSQLDFIDTLGEMSFTPEELELPASEPAAPPEEEQSEWDTLRGIEDSVARLEDEEPDEPDFELEPVEDFADDDEPGPEQLELDFEDEEAPVIEDEPETEPEPAGEKEIDNSEQTRLFTLGEELGSKPRFNLDNLRFGDNYRKEK